MKDYDTLMKNQKDLYHDLKKLKDVLPLLESVEARGEVSNKIFNAELMIQQLWKEACELEEKCSHPKWEYEGSDSHYSYERCIVCGKSEKL